MHVDRTTDADREVYRLEKAHQQRRAGLLPPDPEADRAWPGRKAALLREHAAACRTIVQTVEKRADGRQTQISTTQQARGRDLAIIREATSEALRYETEAAALEARK